MADRTRTITLIGLLAVLALVLSLAVMTGAEQRCYWAVTINTGFQGYVEVPCAPPDEMVEYLREHPEVTRHPKAGRPPR